jgi:hypothetical protein
MSSRLFSSEASIEALITQILSNRTITQTEQQLLQYVLLAEKTLDESVTYPHRLSTGRCMLLRDSSMKT